jgi:hypothetical protein
MTARPRSLLDRVPLWARRGLMIALPLVLLGVLVAGFALAPTPSTRHTSAIRLLPPSRARLSRPTAASTEATASTLPSRTPRFLGPGARGGVGNPDRPPSPRSPAGAMLAVAARFAAAYMPYQIGRLPTWARAAIKRTCTPAFARYLLARPAEQSAMLSAHPKAAETSRVATAISSEPAATTKRPMHTLWRNRGATYARPGRSPRLPRRTCPVNLCAGSGGSSPESLMLVSAARGDLGPQSALNARQSARAPPARARARALIRSPRRRTPLPTECRRTT